MSWKPSRSNGLTTEKYSQKSDTHRAAYERMLEDGSYLKFENLNALSKHLYLYWLNENKKHCTITGSTFNQEKPLYELEACAQFPTIIPMLTRNLSLVYKPLQKYFHT